MLQTEKEKNFWEFIRFLNKELNLKTLSSSYHKRE